MAGMFDSHASAPTVSLGGPLVPPLSGKVWRIVVEAQRNLPAMCQVEFYDDDPAAPVLDNPLLRPGTPLTVDAAPASEDPTTRSLGPVFDGEVVAVEADFPREGGTRVVVRGYDKAHRLHRTRKTRTFLQPENIVVSQIASENGLVPRVDPAPSFPDPSSPTEPFYLCQRNQTDWEFLSERAREIGFEIAVSMGALVFRKAGPDPLAGVPQRLARGENLLTFRPRVSAAEQPMMMTVHAFHPGLKTPVLGLAPPPVPENTPGDPTLLPHTVAAMFGSTEEVETDTPFGLPPAAILHAMARREHAAGVAFEAQGTCIGNPALKPGGTALIQNVGLRFSGTYTLSTVRHVFDEEGFVTHFTISGRHDRSLLGLTQPGAATRANGTSPGGALLGAVVGKVDNNMDMAQMGRVKVSFPSMGNDAVSAWAPVVSVGAGSGKGWQVIPEVGDEVLVVFEHGDVRRPYVLGGLYNAQDLMPQPVGAVLGDGKTQIRAFKTRAGHMLTFNDMPGLESISLETHLGSKLVIQEGPVPSIQLADKTGQNQITIDGATGSISIKALSSMTLEALGSLELKAQGTLTLEAGAAMNVKASGIMNIQGSMVKIN
jgi:phage protein D/phage baseplate assembly protein gpV